MLDEQSKNFLKTDLEYISEPGIELSIGTARLSSRLSQNHTLLVLLAPKVDSVPELKELLKIFFRREIVIFLEGTDNSLHNLCAKSHGPASSRPVTLLPISKVGETDSLAFKNDRMKILKDMGTKDVPEFPDAKLIPLSQLIN